MVRLATLLCICLCATACAKLSKFYDREYVLYDGTAQAAASRPTTQPTSQPTSLPAGVPATPIDRAFALESELDELDRAIRDGLDEDGSLAVRRTAVEKELIDLKRELGDAYHEARRQRLREMTQGR